MRDQVHFPNWLPPLVAGRARVLHAEAVASGSADEAAMVVRITSDPRMQQVWRSLQNKRRDLKARSTRTNKYQFPARDFYPDCGAVREGFKTRAEWIQQAALRALYEEIILFGRQCLPSRQSSEPFNIFHPEASQLRASAAQYANWPGVPPVLLRKRQRQLLRAADACEAVAEANWADNRNSIPGVLTAHIGERLHGMFGKRMYGTTATVATVILGITMTDSEAREHCRGRWSSHPGSGKSPRKRA
jgi:hypothetical protein